MKEPISLLFTDIDQNNLKISLILWCNKNDLTDLMMLKHHIILAILNTLKANNIQRLKLKRLINLHAR